MLLLFNGSWLNRAFNIIFVVDVSTKFLGDMNIDKNETQTVDIQKELRAIKWIVGAYTADNILRNVCIYVEIDF